jgi:hypothetical protein
MTSLAASSLFGVKATVSHLNGPGSVVAVLGTGVDEVTSEGGDRVVVVSAKVVVVPPAPPGLVPSPHEERMNPRTVRVTRTLDIWLAPGLRAEGSWTFSLDKKL